MIGHGASGYTWRAVDAVDGSVVAIKELSFRRLTDLKQLELFEREARALASLDHRGVPDFIDQFVVEEDRFVSAYLVQEFIDGGVLEVGARTDEAGVVRFLEEMAHVLDYLHSRRPPVIHRDIKPSNIMRRGDGTYVLIDFGAIRAKMEDSTGGSTVAGTLGYMAPEQLMGRATARSDYYGLGATALALLAGRQAHHLVDHHRRDAWRTRVTLSDEMARLLSRLLEPDPSQRIGSAEALRRAIEEFKTPEVAQTSRRPPIRRPRRRPWWAAPSLNLSPGPILGRWQTRLWRAGRRGAIPLIMSAATVAVILSGFYWWTPWLYPEFWARLSHFGATFVFEILFLLVLTCFMTGFFATPIFVAAKFLKVPGQWLAVPTGAILVLSFLFWTIIGLSTTMGNLHVVQKGGETRFIAQYSCGFSIIDESGQMVQFFHHRGRDCSSTIFKERFLTASADNGLVYLDAWSGEVYFDLSRKIDTTQPFQITANDDAQVEIKRQDGSTAIYPITLPDGPFEAEISSPLPASEMPTAELHRAEILISDQCGVCPDCGPVVVHYSTAFGQGRRLVSGLDEEGRPIWTDDNPSQDFFTFASAHAVGDQCWLYIPRHSGVTEVVRIDGRDGSMERVWRF